MARLHPLKVWLSIAAILSLGTATRTTYAAAPTDAAERTLHELRQEKLDAAKHLYEETRVSYQRGTTTLDLLYRSSIDWKDSALAVANDKDERLAAIRSHCDRMQAMADEIEQLYQSSAKGGEPDKRASVRYWVLEAKVWIAEEDAK